MSALSFNAVQRAGGSEPGRQIAASAGSLTPTDGDLTTADTNVVLRRYVEHNGLANDHIESFNSIIDSDLGDIFERTFRYTEKTIAYASKKKAASGAAGSDIVTVKIEPKYSGITVHEPRLIVRESGVKLPLTPAFARMNNRYYVAPFTANYDITLTATKSDGTEIVRHETIRSVEITSLPIVERCNKCPLSMMTDEVQIASCEDPLSPGGVYSLGSEWIVNHVENLKFNEFRIFNANHEGIVTRGEMLSKLDNTNGNSAEVIIQLMNTDELVVIVNHKPFRNFAFPFFVMFRLLGAETHKQMMDAIAYEYDSPLSAFIQAKMLRSFEAKYKQFGAASPTASYMTLDRLRDYVITEMGTDFNKAGQDVYEKNKNVWYADLYKYLDRYLLPHLGQEETDRVAKIRALGWYMRMLLLVNCGVYPETDRDSEVSKRNTRSGQCIVKMLKTYINSTIVRPLLDAYEHALKNMSFEDINLKEIHNNTCDSDRLKKLNIKFITGGTKKQIKTGAHGKSIVNRLNSQQKSGGYLWTISNLRQIVSDPTTATSKKSTREHKMRELHRTSFGYKCPVQTQESENIGRNKEQAVTCSISTPSNISLLLETLKPEFEPGGLIVRDPAPHMRPMLTRVTINWSGIELGWTNEPDVLVAKYKHARSRGQIDKLISIVWNIQLSMVIFYCDGDRLIRPLIPVRNNGTEVHPNRAGDPATFHQWSAIGASDIAALKSGTTTIQDLINVGKLEIIDAEEQWFETVIAQTPEHLAANAHNHIVQYTHVEMPASLYGLPALWSNNFNMNNGVRSAYATNHSRQAAAEHSSNWRHRKDKGISLQMYNELPPVYTIANTMTISAGIVCRVAVMCCRYNQEDSQEHSAQLIQSGKLTTEYLEKIANSLGNGEEFRIPSVANSKRKIFADFSTIDVATGFPATGTLLRKGSVVIPKVHKVVNKDTGETTYEDRSSIYTSIEPAIVYKCVEFRNEDDIMVREVYFMKTRNPVIGDKFSSRHGQKGVCGFIFPPNDMPFESDGAIPDIIINPHCMPTRMTTGQWIESAYAMIYAQLCSSIDGTVHSHVNIRDIPAMLESLGFRGDGTAQMFDPESGTAIKTRIFTGLVLYQNLQKNVRDKRYVIEAGPTDIITRGPLKGKSVDGGLRLGEMERDVLLAIGATLFITEKYYWHSNQATIYVCENCGTVPRVNTKYGVDCQLCGDNAQVYAVDTTWASWVFLEELRTLNIKIRLELEGHIYYKVA